MEKIYLVMAINENHETDTFGLSPISICNSIESLYEFSERIEEVSRLAIAVVSANTPFLIDENMQDSWLKDVKHQGKQLIFFDLTEKDE